MCVDIIVICCNFEFMRGGNVDCGLALYGVDFLLAWQGQDYIVQTRVMSHFTCCDEFNETARSFILITGPEGPEP